MKEPREQLLSEMESSPDELVDKILRLTSIARFILMNTGRGYEILTDDGHLEMAELASAIRGLVPHAI